MYESNINYLMKLIVYAFGFHNSFDLNKFEKNKKLLFSEKKINENLINSLSNLNA